MIAKQKPINEMLKYINKILTLKIMKIKILE